VTLTGFIETRARWVVHPIGTTTSLLDDGSMDDINEETEPTEPTEPEENSEEDAVSEAEADDLVDAADADTKADDSETKSDADVDTQDSADAVESEMDEADDDAVAAAAAPAGPPPPQYTQPSRLTRDPFARFGGVLSGIAHRYGWDVSLTRLAFVVLLIISGGTATVAYFLAWLIIPRATHWPPPRVASSRSRLSGRDLGIGLVALGALVVLGIGSGEAAAVLVPLALVGGGIWLLVQNPREEIAAGEPFAPQPNLAYVDAGPTAPATPATPTPAAFAPPAFTQPALTPQAFAPEPPMAPQPVPKRSGLRRVGLFGLFGFLALFLLAIVAVPLILIAVITDGDFDLDDQEYVYRPATVAEIPATITEDVGEIRLDLRNVDFDDVDVESPVEVDIDLDLGRIEVLLPEDVRVLVDAESDLGDVTVLGSNDDGIKPSRTLSQDDHKLELDLNLNVGEIVVARGNRTAITTIELD
jgi:phage shock protein PspC (stress-responsive transcriptional regulator)